MKRTSVIEEILFASAGIRDGRNQYTILAKATEEIGELAQEVMIAAGDHYKPAGKDGVIGEGVDLMICAIDMIASEDPCITEEEILVIVRRKLGKWAEKAMPKGLGNAARVA